MTETIRDTILWYSKPRLRISEELKRKHTRKQKVSRSLRKKAWSPCYIL